MIQPFLEEGRHDLIEELWRLLYRRWLMPRQPGVGLLWSGSAEGVWRLRLLLWGWLEVDEAAMARGWFPADVPSKS